VHVILDNYATHKHPKAVRADDSVVAASEIRRLEERMRELERLLVPGRPQRCCLSMERPW
jgi:hypothetical protein